LTTYAAGIDGAITGIGVAADAGGAWATEVDEINTNNVATTPHVTRTPKSGSRIFSSVL
jgi:hypothetical protein